MKFRYAALTLAVATSFYAGVALADDSSAQDKYDTALSLYTDERADQAKNNEAITLLEQAVNEASDADLKYDILILTSRAYYWKGVNVPGDEENNEAKVGPFGKGLAAAEAAIKVDGAAANAYYYAAISLGKWGLAKGKLTVVGKVGYLEDLLANVKAKLTRDGDPGATFDAYGYNRVYGRLNHKMAILPGKSVAKALAFLKESYEKGRENAVNVLYYADVLAEDGQKEAARSVLRELLKNDPETYNPDRVPETRLEFQDARKMLSKFGG